MALLSLLPRWKFLSASVLLAGTSHFLHGCAFGTMNGTPKPAVPTTTTDYWTQTIPPRKTTTRGPTPPPSPTPPSPSPPVPTTTQGPPSPPPPSPPSPPPSPGLCFPSDTLGCLNGVPFDRATHFACGAAEQSGRQAIYEKATTSCCAQGLRFDPRRQFCCYDGVHDDTDGECAVWTDSFPTECYCVGPPEHEELPLGQLLFSLDTSSALVNTALKTNEEPCTGPVDAATGCLNGHPYDYSSEQPCGDHILNVYDYGCCPTGEHGMMPYKFSDQSCCQREDGTNVISRGGHACTCKKRDCPRDIATV